MANFSNTIRTTIDVVSDKASAGVKSFRESIAEADGASGKLKAGFGQASGFIKENAAALAATAGTALLGFAANAVASFQNLALEAGKMSDTLGISTESASRWIEVAGDIGASTEDVTKAMTRMERQVAATPDAFADLGIEIARTSSGAVDANETFLRTLEALKRIKDPTERQAAANKLLGRSWGEIAELVNGDVREAYESVSDAKLVSEQDVEDARAFRDTLDTLRGVVEDLSNKLAKNLLPVITDVAQTIEENEGTFDKAFDLLGKGLQGAAKQFGLAKGDAQAFYDEVGDGGDKVEAASQKTSDGFLAMVTSAQDASVAAEGLAEEIAALEEETQKLLDTVNAAIDSDLGYQRSLNATEDAAVALFGKIQDLNKAQGDDRASALEEVQRAELDLLGAYVSQSEAAVKLYEDNIALSGGTLTAADAARIQRDELLKVLGTLEPGSPLAVSLQGYIDKLNDVPGVVTTTAEVNTSAALSKIAELRAQIGALAAYTGTARSSYMDPAAAAKALQGVDLSGLGKIPQGATGGIVTQPTLALIGEAGPEAVVPLNQAPGASPLPAGMGSSSATPVINIYANVIEKDTARWIVEQIAKARQTMGAATVQRAVNG